MCLKIGVISSFELTNHKEYIDRICNDESQLIFRVGALSNAIDIALDLQNTHHVDAIIAYAATSRILMERIDVPVIALNIKSMDLLKALSKACRIGEKPAFVEIDTQSIIYDFDEVVSYLGREVKRYQFHGFNYVDEIADQIVADGCDIVASMGNRTIDAIRQRGIETIFFTPCVQSFVEAVEEAKHILKERKKEARKNKWMNSIFNETSNGIIAWDPLGYVVVFNSAAKRALPEHQNSLLGKNILNIQQQNPLIKRILDSEENYVTIRNATKEYVASKRDIYDDEDDKFLLGSIIQINELSKIQSMEMHARKSKITGGFVARHHFDDIRGDSDCMMELKETAKRYAQSSGNILISGESGTGKEMFAQSIHNSSKYKDGPFVAINCSALTDTLLESELFGYEEGSFTGAKKSGKPGLFELAHGGTFFLDEVGEMPLHLQVKLLRVLQERTVRRIGGEKNIPLNIRFIFATNRNLEEEVEKKTFRGDLFYRINVLPLHIPPLREHKKDIIAIIKCIEEELSHREDTNFYLPKSSMELIVEYDWPGNGRELYNFIERLSVLGTQPEDKINHLIFKLISENRSYIPNLQDAKLGSGINIPIASLKEMEDQIYQKLYQKYGGNKKKIAETLDISGSTVWRRFKDVK